MRAEDNKEVLFDKYCPFWKYAKVIEYENPCNECLEQPMREGTEKPMNYKEKGKE